MTDSTLTADPPDTRRGTRDRLAALPRTLRDAWTDPLVRNALFLTATSGAIAVLGFGFWLLNARFYAPAEIGLASTVLSAISLLAYLCLMGMNSLVIRNAAEDLSDLVSTAVAVVAVAGTVGATGYVLVAPHVSSELGDLLTAPWAAAAFVGITVLAAVNVLTDSAFIARRAAEWNLGINAVLQGAVKIGLALALTGLGAFGIVTASGIAVGLCALTSLLVLATRLGLRLRPHVSWRHLREGASFSGATYVASALHLTPPVVVPMIVLAGPGAAGAGYYFIAFQMAGIVFAVADAVGESLFTEGAHGRDARELRRRSLRLLLGVTGVGTVAGLVGSGPLLAAFGPQYAEAAVDPLRVLLLSAPAVALQVWSGFVLKAAGRIGPLVGSTVVYVVAVIGLTWLWVGHGLVGVAAAWAVGNLLTALVAWPFLDGQPKDRRREGRREGRRRGRSAPIGAAR